MATAAAFLRRDIALALSYRIGFVMQLADIFVGVTLFYFLSLMLGGSVAPQLEQYGGDYFSFVLIGIAFSGYMGRSLSSYAHSIREGQMMGTLEIMLLSPTRLSAILLSSSLWPYLLTTVGVIAHLALGTAFFGFSLSQANFGAALVVLLLSITSFSGIGVLSAAMVLIVKRGSPVAWLFGGVSSLLAGVYYPISVLPDWLEPLSRALPLTYALDAMRLTMLQGSSLYEVRSDIVALAAFTVVLTPVALFVFRLALRRAKMEGSLIQY